MHRSRARLVIGSGLGRGVHAALARRWVDLSPPQMWVLADSLPACRGRQLPAWDCWTTCRPPGLVMTEDATQTAAGSGAGTEVLRAPEELDLATADGLAA